MRDLLFFVLIQLLFFNNNFVLAQWNKINSPEGTLVNSLLINEGNYFAKTNNGLFISTDQGIVWRSINNGLPNLPSSNAWCLAVNGTHLFVGFDGDGVFVSSNNGTDWSPANNGLSNKRVDCLVTNGNNIFAGTIQGGIFLSTNNGNSWEEVNNGISTSDRWVTSMAFNDSKIYATVNLNGIYSSNDNGSNWVRLTQSTAAYIAVDGSRIFAAAYKTGVLYSLDNGITWSLVYVGPGPTLSRGFAFNDINVFVANSSGVFCSTDNGTTWQDINSNITGLGATFLTVSSDSIFAIFGGEIWVRSLSEITTVIDQNGKDRLPSNYLLEQNYPNPFNPMTIIKYSVPKLSFVTLKVFDALGRETSILVSENKNVGNYEVKFDASSLASGIYFYQLQSGKFSETKKLIIMK